MLRTPLPLRLASLAAFAVSSLTPSQFQYTPPTLCANPRCQNRRDFQLLPAESTFTDWQRLRVQENAGEVPPGSMPRSIDVIVRGEGVEGAKAGDKCVFTGFLAVVPDGGGLARAGEAATSSRPTHTGHGVSGLKSLGVRELTYKTGEKALLRNIRPKRQVERRSICSALSLRSSPPPVLAANTSSLRSSQSSSPRLSSLTRLTAPPSAPRTCWPRPRTPPHKAWPSS